eukprot:gene17904-22121_t
MRHFSLLAILVLLMPAVSGLGGLFDLFTDGSSYCLGIDNVHNYADCSLKCLDGRPDQAYHSCQDYCDGVESGCASSSSKTRTSIAMSLLTLALVTFLFIRC